MARTISIGAQGFEELRTHGDFYVDKTSFVRDWWTSRDVVTLVCRPRRFGKTLNLDTVRCFLSTEFAGRGEELFGGEIQKVIDEQVVFSELSTRPNAAWALLLAAGYVTSPGPVPEYLTRTPRRLRLTNLEVSETFDRMVKGWFDVAEESYGDFARALLAGDAESATNYLSEVTLACMSSFDGISRTAKSQPERFYHGLVLGLLVSLRGRWSVESNRESGYGRYDVALVPIDGANGADPAVVVEFKVFDPRQEKTLEDTVIRAWEQIEERAYVAGLIARGIAPERIRTYGIAFRGKEVLVA